MAASSTELAEKMVLGGVLMGLVLTLANKKHNESQKQAAGLLLYLIDIIPSVAEAMKDSLGTTFYEFFFSKPDTFYREINREQVRYLKRNAFRLRRTSRMGASSGYAGNREEMPMNPFQAGFPDENAHGRARDDVGGSGDGME
jgi:hypothetical protein